MSLEIKVPTVGESITEVTIAEWTKKDGDYVEMDEVIAELESDKATFELNAEQAGVLHIKTEAGETVEIGAVICEIDTSASENGEKEEKKSAEQEEASASDSKKEKTEKPADTKEDSPQEAQSLEMKIPTVGESITEVTISEWLKEDGEQVEMDEVIAEIESDKATFELTAEAAGTLRIKAQAGETLEIGALACVIETNGQGSSAPSQSSDTADKEKASTTSSGAEGKDNGRETYATGHASPAASKILAEKGIDPKQVKGSGVDGRITKEDAEKAEKTSPAQSKPTQPSEKAGKKETEAPKTTGEDEGRQQRREKMSSLRKTISRRLVAAKNETAMLTTFNEVDMKPVMDLRKKYKEAFKEKYEVNLGFMSFFTKAACLALKEWPAVNAFIDGEELVYNDYCDVSIAVSSPKGLVVPVIRNAEAMSFDQIEKEVVRLAKKARDGKLSIDEMTGGTFTVTNGGIFGSMLSTPIINQPQSAILGMHNIVERPVAINGQVEIRPIMYVALSYDHRVIDGRESVSFLYRIKELIEDPSRLLLGI
ncbi:2-oxoglutarate dehydrogenase E2 component (dihydrolipoamide succinyltransferase) [Catalinimonas alkaloidigena]|uniref:2-oxoglutarate dehydrogenase complex dihydrolipoyllysine-residue succinyltransferase n=1 Tax=Catalinimonas alkaloidigena TaxID=1075417 RepID=UPI0024052ECF|nr:2-oxoglutarate dehydrogenase complex dihydrolipoyllysine-residue succinyltransferase [Catalinimonas alkaloidigena]MDF9800630.1 2-oxoglutarate dehydrogenase E2 component (dihydrolipoamide succinyltransferase) [Catalinimonas alkaloidigena]